MPTSQIRGEASAFHCNRSIRNLPVYIPNVTGTNPNRIKGIHGHALGARYNMGVMGSVGASSDMFAGAGIFGAVTTYPITFTGVWAGYFFGNVKVTSNIYGTLVSSAPTSASNASYGIMNDEQLGISERLQNIDLLQWERKVEDANEETSRASYGLAADQVREVFPELVIEDEHGDPCINYVEMVPLLVQTIKELNICEGATLTINNLIESYQNVSITISPNATLIVDGGVINKVTVKPTTNSNVKLINNGQITTAQDAQYSTPMGATMHISSGTVK